MINVNGFIRLPNNNTIVLQDGNYPSGLTIKMYYDNPPSNTVYSSSSSNQWYQSRLLQDCMIQLALNQQRIYEQGYDTKEYSNASLSKIAEVKAETSQIVTLLGGTPQAATFNNYSAKLQRIDEKLANMQPEIITQSMSFFAGVICAIAFVLAVKSMKG